MRSKYLNVDPDSPVRYGTVRNSLFASINSAYGTEAGTILNLLARTP
jgi:hypothetical protein